MLTAKLNQYTRIQNPICFFCSFNYRHYAPVCRPTLSNLQGLTLRTPCHHRQREPPGLVANRVKPRLRLRPQLLHQAKSKSPHLVAQQNGARRYVFLLSPTLPSVLRPLTLSVSFPQVLEDEETPAPNDDQLVSQITQHLRSQEVQASKDHANVIHEAKGDGVKAYAKVAAQDWTFYITKLNVNIGRAPEASHNTQTASSEEDESHIHIDLGPSKMVSREHATISFVSKDEKWFLRVKGRNGAKVDSQPVKAGQSHPLTSGEVVEIGNVEMMFVLPSEITPLTVHPIYLQRAGVSVHTPQSRTSRRQPLIAPAPPEYKRPGTPPSAQSAIKSPATSTPAVMVGANGVDLSQDENQHIKPQYSYAQMITQAILNAPDGKLNLNGIYNYIMNTYAYYRHQQAAGWQVSLA